MISININITMLINEQGSPSKATISNQRGGRPINYGSNPINSKIATCHLYTHRM